MDAELLADIAGVYDRAALIALPPPLRQHYRDTLYARVPQGCQGVLITLEYPQDEKQGPPFSVDQANVMQLFSAPWQATLLERRDILDDQPDFRAQGVTALSTAVYRTTKL
ncbi:Thiopurine S-methyltransferase [compost metagenome]